MIITSNNDNKVGTFYFTGADYLGTKGEIITEGKIFLVDTLKPNVPINLEPLLTSDGNVRLRWYYDGEPIDEFRIYRAISQDVGYIDFYGSTNNNTQFVDESTTNRVTYYYKVNAVDNAGNIGPLSEEVYITAIKEGQKEVIENITPITQPEPKLLPPNLVVNVNDMIKKFDVLEIDLKEIESQFKDSESEKKELIDTLGLITEIDKTKDIIGSSKNQLENLKLEYKAPSELDSELSKFDLEIKMIRQTMPKEVELLEKAEFVQTINRDDTKLAVDLLFNNFNDKEKKNYINLNEQVQATINIEVKIKSLKIKYLDENTKKLTFVSKKISRQDPSSLKDVIFMEIFPENWAGDISKISFKPDDYEKVEDKPTIIKWGFTELNYEGQTIEYSIEDETDINKIKEINSVILVGPLQLGTSKVTGYSIFSLFSGSIGLTKGNMLLILAGILVIAVLISYYFFMPRIDVGTIRDNIGLKLSRLRAPKKTRKLNLENYPDIPKLEKNRNIYFTEKRLSKAKDEFSVINELIERSQEHLSTDDFDKAAAIYPKIELLYRNLPKELKPEAYTKCMELKIEINRKRKEFESALE